MRDIKSACQRCHRPLSLTSPDAFICGNECTWCRACAIEPLDLTCPTCGDELRHRLPLREDPIGDGIRADTRSTHRAASRGPRREST